LRIAWAAHHVRVCRGVGVLSCVASAAGEEAVVSNALVRNRKAARAKRILRLRRQCRSCSAQSIGAKRGSLRFRVLAWLPREKGSIEARPCSGNPWQQGVASACCRQGLILRRQPAFARFEYLAGWLLLPSNPKSPGRDAGTTIKAPVATRAEGASEMPRLPIPGDSEDFSEETRAAVRHIRKTRTSMPPPSSYLAYAGRA
jgi:hypothetical protein